MILKTFAWKILNFVLESRKFRNRRGMFSVTSNNAVFLIIILCERKWNGAGPDVGTKTAVIGIKHKWPI